MKLNYSSQLLDNNGNLLDTSPTREAICLCYGQFTSPAASRSEHRKIQSYAARQLLSRSLRYFFCGEAPNWQLDKSSSGKPFLRGSDAPAISLAHSGNWVACAISRVAAIGVDIEAIKPRDWNSYGGNVFHENETSWVMAAPAEERNVRGLTCWCRKEALTKALGTGLTVSPSQIAFSPEGSLCELPPDLGARAGWMSYTHTLPNEAVMAVAWKN